MKKIDEGSFNSAFLGFDKKQVSEYINSLTAQVEELKSKYKEKLDCLESEKESLSDLVKKLEEEHKEVAQSTEALTIKIEDLEEKLSKEKSNNSMLSNNYLKLKSEFDALNEKYELEAKREQNDMTAVGKVMLNVQSVCEKTISDAKNEADKLIGMAKNQVDDCKAKVGELGSFYKDIKQGILDKMKLLEQDLNSIDENIKEAEKVLIVDTESKHHHIAKETEHYKQEAKDSLNVIALKKNA